MTEFNTARKATLKNSTWLIGFRRRSFPLAYYRVNYDPMQSYHNPNSLTLTLTLVEKLIKTFLKKDYLKKIKKPLRRRERRRSTYLLVLFYPQVRDVNIL